MPVTQRQIELLAPYLEGSTPTHTNVDKDTGERTREWNLHCPLHGDERRSASINLEKGVFYCNRCGGMPVTALIRRRDEWVAFHHMPNGTPNVNGHPPDKPLRTLTQGMVSGWHSALMSNPSALQWLKERRGLRPETLERFEIGWDGSQHVYTIPVRDEEGNVVNIRFYNPNPVGDRRKIWSENGYGSPPRLYPISILDEDPEEVLVVAGEWDALLAIQYGFNAITRTAGENHWDMGWAPWFAGRRVWTCQDADAEGVAGNRKIASSLVRVVAEGYTITLPYEYVPKHGADITDLLLDHGPDRLRSLMEEAKPWNGTKEARELSRQELETVTVLDTSDAARVGKPVKVVVTIKGRKEPGYTIPKQVKLVCSQDAGNKCMICPLRAVNGEADVVIESDDPLVLKMVDARTEDVQLAIAESYGVPGGKCSKLQQEVGEYQAVEVLFGRPALDHVDGSDTGADAARYKTLRITSVGRHDTPPNNTVAVTGALQPSPKSQANEFLAHEIEMLETSVDRFELNEQSIRLMRRFQSDRPLEKVAEISKAMSEHVTRIQGRPEMHALMDLVFHSALSFEFAGELVDRGWLEALILGDTRTGKSLAGKRLCHHYGAGEIISGESSTFAGVVGGLQQINGRDWAVTWGVVPINDKRLVIMDEISGLTPEEIAQMSDIRSSGQAKLTKIVSETTWARTRLLWLGNPRNATMANYTYGVDAIKPLIGNAEDIARFDLAMVVTLFDVPSETINQPVSGGELVYTSEACHTLLMWAWTRKPEDIVWDDYAEARVFSKANEIGKLYIEDPPLIQAANVRIKIARLAVAIAARTFSTDSSCEKIVVKPAHVDAAVRFINILYGMQVFGYRERSREQLADRLLAEQNKEKIRKYLKQRPLLAKYLRTNGRFRRQDLDEILNQDRVESNAIISTLYEARMVRKEKGDILVEPTLHMLLREVKL